MIPIARPLIGPEEAAGVAQVLASGMLASGPRVAEFEQAFARYVGAQHAVATSNGTTALHAALVALGVGPGDEVVVPAFTFVATANAVLFTGATPVFADIEPATFTLDPKSFERALTERTKAVIPVHLYGQAADMPRIERIAAKRSVHVLGDAAQAHGAALNGKRIGAWGACEAFSFYPTKNMTTGEGGIVTTDDAALADRLRSFVNHGRARSELGTYNHVALGHNFRMTDVHAAIGLAQLAKLEAWNERRRENAAQLAKGLEGSAFVVPVVREGARHVYHQFTLRATDRASVIRSLTQAGIGHGIYYPSTLAEYPHLSRFARQATPEAEQAAHEALSVPVHPAVDAAGIERVVGALRAT